MREDPNEVYDRARCRTCGTRVSEHKSTCSRHKFIMRQLIADRLAGRGDVEPAVREGRPRPDPVGNLPRSADDAELARRELEGGSTREWTCDGTGRGKGETLVTRRKPIDAEEYALTDEDKARLIFAVDHARVASSLAATRALIETGALPMDRMATLISWIRGRFWSSRGDSPREVLMTATEHELAKSYAAAAIRNLYEGSVRIGEEVWTSEDGIGLEVRDGRGA